MSFSVRLIVFNQLNMSVTSYNIVLTLISFELFNLFCMIVVYRPINLRLFYRDCRFMSVHILFMSYWMLCLCMNCMSLVFLSLMSVGRCSHVV